MKFRQVVAGLLTAGLVGFVPVVGGASSPAQAAAPAAAAQSTRVSITLNGIRKVEFGRSAYVSAKVFDANGAAVYDGTVTLYANNGKGWRVLDTGSSGYVGKVYVPGRTTRYVAKFSGYGAEYTASSSRTATVRVARKNDITARRTTFRGKVSPAYKRKKIVIDRKIGKKWKRHAVVRTNGRSVWTKKLPALNGRKKTFYRITVPAGRGFIKNSEVWYTYRIGRTTLNKTL